MDCKQTESLLDDYLDEHLESDTHQVISAHIAGCTHCSQMVNDARRLRSTLRRLPAPSLRPGFAEQAFAKAREAQQQPRQRFNRRFNLQQKMTAGALAAGFAVWMITAPFIGNHNSDNGMPVQFVSVDEVKTISVAMNAQKELHNVTLTLVLPEGIEVDGYNGQREITWNTNLVAGVNLLPLPIRALNAGSGTLIARISHDGQSRQLRVPINAGNKQQSGLVLDAMQAG